MPDNQSMAADRARVVRILEQVEQRLRIGRLTRDLLAGFTVSLAIPAGLSLWYRFSSLALSTILIVLGMWLVGLAAYATWRLTERGTLAAAAAAVDRRADLHDELTSAYWFSRAGLTSGWIELQLRRAARTADMLEVGTLYPFVIPRSSRTAVALLVLVFVLNLIPLSWTRGWLQAQPPPIFELSQADRIQLDEIQRLLEQAVALQGSELSEQAQEALENLRQGRIAENEALDELRALLEQFDTRFDADLVDQLVENLAEAFNQSSSTEAVAEALEAGDLETAAEELRELAERLELTDSELQELEASLEQLSEQAREALGQLSKDLAEAVEQLRQQNPELAQRALEQLANDLEQIARAQQSDELRDAAAQELEQLAEALRQRDGAEGERAAVPKQDGLAAAEQGMATEVGETGTPSTERGRTDVSAPGAGDEIQYGEPTRLEVELHPELLELQLESKEEPDKPLIDQPSQAARSALQYEQVETDLTYAEPELLNTDRIPWPYRHLVKRYFQAVGPRGKHDH